MGWEEMVKHQILAACALVGALVCAALAPAPAAAQEAAPAAAQITVHADQPGPTINRDIYGQFAEHLGAGIYGGVWVGPDSPIPNTNGYRNDVIAALRDLHVPVVRWPGGCFADEYHWREGVGPRESRPVKVNTTWGGVPETNAFGTHEFMTFAEMIGAQAYINGNVGTGSPREMAEWMEYMTSNTTSTLANMRRQNGRDAPWDVGFWAVGNETWGCGGNMRPEYYADVYRQFATFLKAPHGHRPKLIASGGHDDDTIWTDVLSRTIHHDLDAISFHYYTTPTGIWAHKGASIGFPESEWISTFAHTLRMDGFITNNERVLDRNDPDGHIAFYVDEWGTWYDPEPGREPGFLYQQNSLRDALVAAVNFNIFHKHAKRVQMTNIAQMVNVLQAMILTDGPRMALTPTYHVYQMYIPFQDATFLPSDLRTPRYALGRESVPAVSASAARDAQGHVVLALANLDPNREAAVSVRVAGAPYQNASGRVLTAASMDAHNTVDDPNAVAPAPISGAREGDAIVLRLPAKSVAVVTIQ
jgi:alpha-L-arabinofuranosidase